MNEQDARKQAVAKAALAYVEDDSIVGVGTGSTADFFIDALAGIKGRIAGAVASSEKTAARLQQHGIRVRGVLGEQTVPVRATNDPAQLGLADMALVLVDAAATSAAAAIAKGCLKPDGFALSLQNGIGNLEALVEALGPQRVMAGMT